MEVLVILGIVGILLSLAFPAVQQVRERARNTQCANNLHQIGIAAQQHASAHGTFPGTSMTWSIGGPNGSQIQPAISPHRHLLASIDAGIHAKIDFKDLMGAGTTHGTITSLGPIRESPTALAVDRA